MNYIRPVSTKKNKHDVNRASLADALDRPLRDLRLSVTDRCNFRCRYCMPREHFGKNYRFVDHDRLLSFEEIARIVEIFAAHGVEKLRITGGEPLLRRNIENLISRLCRIEGIRDICMTTNGSLLTREKATELKNAGLKRITVSLDALDRSRFSEIVDVGVGVDRVLSGIDNALTAGLSPVKVNMVVIRGVNDDDILQMVRQFRHSGVVLRFIEFMDVGNCNEWEPGKVVEAGEILRLIHELYPLESLEPTCSGEVATRWKHADGGGEIGVIASVSKPFCGTCNRIRLSAEGQLHTCLFATHGHDLRAILRGGNSEQEISDSIATIWRKRNDRYSELRGQSQQILPKIEMSYIGG